MSKIAEAYLENSRRITLTPEGEKLLDEIRQEEIIGKVIEEVVDDIYSEIEMCLLFGIPCSYGICSECEEWRKEQK